MPTKQFLKGNGYQTNDTVMIDDKLWRIKRIVGDTAHLSYWDGVAGYEQKIERKLSQLPVREVEIAPEVAPHYEADQKLDNGWVIVKPTTKGHYLVNTGDDKVEMSAAHIYQAEGDYRKALLDEITNSPTDDEAEDFLAMLDEDDADDDELSDDQLHEMAEQFAKQSIYDDEEKQDSVTPDGRGVPRPYDNTSPITDETIETMLKSLEALASLPDTVADLSRQVESFGARLDGFEARLDGVKQSAAAIPSPSPATDQPEIEVMTLVGREDGGGFVEEIAKLRSQGWEQVYVKCDGTLWTVMLERPRAAAVELLTERKTFVPRTVMGMVVDDPEGELTPMVAALRKNFTHELSENTLRFMERRGA